MKKVRLDVLLVEKGLFASREQSRSAIMAGTVKIKGRKVVKPGCLVKKDVELIVDPGQAYVSRGGYKLEKAINSFAINLEGKKVLDIGASTGGFTDCALKHGAVKVYAVDVGYGQLAWRLRNDFRVVVLERKNARYLSTVDVPEPVDLITIDVSFISVTKIIPAVSPYLAPSGAFIILVKPQFEAGKSRVGRKGVIKDPSIHCEVLENLLASAPTWGLFPLQLTYSPLKGPEGNIEYLVMLGTSFEPAPVYPSQIVKEAHAQLI